MSTIEVRSIKVGDRLVGKGIHGTVLHVTMGVQGWTRGITTDKGTWTARATGKVKREDD